MSPLGARFIRCCLLVKRGKPQGGWQSSPQSSFVCIYSLISWYKSEISCVVSNRKLEKKIQSCHQLTRHPSPGCPSKRLLGLHKRTILVMLQKHRQKTIDWNFSHTLFFFFFPKYEYIYLCEIWYYYRPKTSMQEVGEELNLLLV